MTLLTRKVQARVLISH